MTEDKQWTQEDFDNSVDEFLKKFCEKIKIAAREKKLAINTEQKRQCQFHVPREYDDMSYFYIDTLWDFTLLAKNESEKELFLKHSKCPETRDIASQIEKAKNLIKEVNNIFLDVKCYLNDDVKKERRPGEDPADIFQRLFIYKNFQNKDLTNILWFMRVIAAREQRELLTGRENKWTIDGSQDCTRYPYW